jgi:hypothetical protein
VNLLMPSLPDASTGTAETTLKNYTNAWNVLSEIVKTASSARDAAGNILPGGSLRLAAASSRSVSIDETFDPPVILGYLGFDCAIFKGGLLGPPIPTHAVLDSGFNLGNLLNANPVYGQMLDIVLYRILQKDSGPKSVAVRTLLDGLEAFVPNEFINYTGASQTGPGNFLLTAERQGRDLLHPASFKGYAAYHGFRAKLRDSITSLKTALALDAFQYKTPSNATDVVTRDSPMRRELEGVLEYYTHWQDQTSTHPTVQNAFSEAYRLFLELQLQ